MAMSGGKKESAVNSATKKAVAASAPKSYSDPYGSFDGKTGVYNPNLNATQLATQGTLQTGINNAANTVANTSFDVNDLYNNPFYQSTYDLYSAPTLRQYTSDLTSLDNELNAKGLVGGSYDAIRRNKLDQGRDYNLNQNALQARQGSANAYQQQYQNALAGLSGLGGAQAQQTANIYQPFNNYVAYQNAVNPGSQTAANAYANQANLLAQQPTWFDNYLKWQSSAAQGAASAAKAGAGGG